MKINWSGCWFSMACGVSPDNYCLGQRWEGYLVYLTTELCTSCVPEEGTDTSFRKASHPN